MVLSCLLKRTLQYTRVFWDTFSSKHNSLFVKISLVSSREECGSSWDLTVVVDYCLIANSSEHRGLRECTQDCRSPGMPCGGLLGDKTRRK